MQMLREPQVTEDDRWIAIGGVRELVRQGTPFSLKCERAGSSRVDGRPCYMIKVVVGNHERVVTTSFASRGIKPRLFSLWPGVVKFVTEFGDGRDIALNLTAPTVAQPSKKMRAKK